MKNRLFYGDCLDVLRKSIDDESIDLVYIDPPFNSKRNYNVLFESLDMTDVKAQKEAFADTWSNVKYVDQLAEIQDLHLDLHKYLCTLDSIAISKSVVSYLTTMAFRIFYIHRKLKPTGSFYLHCDPTMSHYLKVVCDLIFGEKNFLNEIAWCYRERGISKTYYNKKHDTLLFYAKHRGRQTFNCDEIRERYSSVSIKKFKYVDENGIRYRLRYKDGRSDPPMETEETYRQYLDEDKGPLPLDWIELPFLNQAANERQGYPTQKPEALLERIIKASSNKGEIVADFFCGCGTAVAVAQRLKRRWIGVDISHLAIRLIYNRLLKPYRPNPDRLRKIKDNLEIDGFPRDIASAHELATSPKTGRIKFQDWVIEFMLDGVSHDLRRGYDGYLTLMRDAKKKDIVLIEVKSGAADLEDMREFVSVVEHEHAAIGVFVGFDDKISRQMRIEAQRAGYYEREAYGTKFPRVQVLTVEELLNGKSLAHPNPHEFNVTFK